MQHLGLGRAGTMVEPGGGFSEKRPFALTVQPMSLNGHSHLSPARFQTQAELLWREQLTQANRLDCRTQL